MSEIIELRLASRKTVPFEIARKKALSLKWKWKDEA